MLFLTILHPESAFGSADGIRSGTEGHGISAGMTRQLATILAACLGKLVLSWTCKISSATTETIETHLSSFLINHHDGGP